MDPTFNRLHPEGYHQSSVPKISHHPFFYIAEIQPLLVNRLNVVTHSLVKKYYLNCLFAAYEIKRKPLSLSFKAFHSGFQFFSNIFCTFCFPIKTPPFSQDKLSVLDNVLLILYPLFPMLYLLLEWLTLSPLSWLTDSKAQLSHHFVKKPAYTVAAHTNYFPLLLPVQIYTIIWEG